jgi:hypothetical protein
MHQNTNRQIAAPINEQVDLIRLSSRLNSVASVGYLGDYSKNWARERSNERYFSSSDPYFGSIIAGIR